jgi:DNA-binding GntR family transcriptional regulator
VAPVALDSTASAPSATTEGVTSERIATALKGSILAGEIAPGEWLRQDEIATRFGASRLPVREALRILESQGLAEISPNKGARVPTLSLGEVHTYYRMRERLEPLTLIESLPHLTDDQIAHLESLQDQIERNTDVSLFLMLDREFHMTSYSGCPSRMLLATTVRLWNATQHYRRAYMLLAGNDRASIVNAEHWLLLDAIRRRDAADAERFLEGHIRRTRVALTGHPELFAS